MPTVSLLRMLRSCGRDVSSRYDLTLLGVIGPLGGTSEAHPVGRSFFKFSHDAAHYPLPIAQAKGGKRRAGAISRDGPVSLCDCVGLCRDVRAGDVSHGHAVQRLPVL